MPPKSLFARLWRRYRRRRGSQIPVSMMPLQKVWSSATWWNTTTRYSFLLIKARTTEAKKLTVSCGWSPTLLTQALGHWPPMSHPFRRHWCNVAQVSEQFLYSTSAHRPLIVEQCIALTRRNRTGPPCSVRHPIAHAGSVTDDRRQRAKQYWPIRRASNNDKPGNN